MTWLTWIATSRLGRAVGAVAGFLALLFLARQSGKRDARKDMEIEDHENANEIDTRVDADRADPERLRPFEDSGFRD